jgi:cystathionine beta-lyase/cystathionine gamma-synthase
MTIGFATKAVHSGQDPDPSTGAVIPPISLSTTFEQAAAGVHKGYEYSRAGNPTRKALETALAALENGTHGNYSVFSKNSILLLFRECRYKYNRFSSFDWISHCFCK